MGEVIALIGMLGRASHLESHPLVERACRKLAPAVTSVSLALPDGAGNLHWFLLSGTPGEPTRLVDTLVAQHTAAGAAMAARHVVCSDNPALGGTELEDWRGLREACQSANCAPLLMGGVALGSLNLTSSQPHAFSGLQQAFGAVAAALAPHLRLAQSERALQATRQLLHDAASLEQAQSTAWQRHQKRQAEAAAAGPQQPAAPATPRGDPALRAQSSTTVDSVDLAPPTATAAAANTLAAPPGPALEQQLAARLLTAPRTAARHAVQWLQAAVGVSFRPAPEQPRAPLQRISSARKPGKGKGCTNSRQFGQGYAFDDYEFSSDDESTDPSTAAAATALAAPLHRWHGPLGRSFGTQLWDAADEGAYIDWACGAWQAPVDIAAGSAALGHTMLLMASPNTDCIGCALFDGGWLLGVCRMRLAALLLMGVRLVLLRRSHYVRHREWLVLGVRLLCAMITAIRVVHQAPTADGCAAKLWLLAAPVVAVLPFAAQVRFSRHLLLSALQLAIILVAFATTGGLVWREAIPVKLSQVVGMAVLATAGLYFIEAAARRSFIGSRAAQPVS